MEELLKETKAVLKGLNLDHLIKYIDDLEKSIEKVHIAFVGEYNAGKSSLINTLLGREVVAERDLPTTNRIVLVTYCPIEKREKLDYSTDLICINDTKLKDIVLVDTPGLSSAIEEHETTLFNYLHKADLIVIVAPSTQPYSKEIEMLLHMLAEKHSTQWAYVLNLFEDPKVYEKDPKKIDRLKEFVRENLRKVLSSEEVKDIKIFAFSVAKVKENDKSYPKLVKEWEDFKRFIFEEIAEKAKRIKFASIKEKLLKLLTGNEILNKQTKLENLELELSKWKNLRDEVTKYIEEHLERQKQVIEQYIDTTFRSIEKDVEDMIDQYSNSEIVKNPKQITDSLQELLKVRIYSGEILKTLETLLDYRPIFVNLKRIYSEVVVEPTIPVGLQEKVEKFKEELLNLPQKLKYSELTTKLSLGSGILFILGGAASFAFEAVYPGIASLSLGLLLTAYGIYRYKTAKGRFKKFVKNRLDTLKEFYKKSFSDYLEMQVKDKESKVLVYLDQRIKQLEIKVRDLKGKLDKVDELIKEITFVG
jgi:GTPase Era involved in 16S rRNA processing